MDIERITVRPVYDADDNRIGTRVWQGGVELPEDSPVFRAAACGKRWQGDSPSEVTDADTRHIVGGPVILRRAEGPNRSEVLARARSRLERMPDRM